MNKIKLDKEEKQILADMDRGAYSEMPNAKDFAKKLQKSAEEANKSRPVSIRLSERDLTRLKAKAAAEGLPYQTLIRSVLHKYSEAEA